MKKILITETQYTKLRKSILESKLRSYVFDWDDNILRMPTKVNMEKNENGNWQMCIVTGLNTVFCFEPILQYVHQLQNLYYSLTDSQLIYKH